MFKKPAPAPEPNPAQPPPNRRATDRRENLTVIAAGLQVTGDIEGGDSVDMAGSLDGDAEVEGFFHVGEKGRVKGTIKADQVLIEGEVEGESIVANEKVVLGVRSRVHADLDTASLAIGEGSFLQGHVHMRGGGKGQVSFKERRKQ